MQLFQVDSFTNQAFKGNPAGVCLVNSFPDNAFMQSLAMEMNLSETAFVEIAKQPFNIRFFTPAMEVPICGHATLASAHILYQLGIVEINNNFKFKAPETDLIISKQGDWIAMDFPTYPITEIGIEKSFGQVLGVEPVKIFKSSNNWHICEVKSEEEVAQAEPDFALFAKFNLGLMLIVTASSRKPGIDFVVRVFCDPKSGISEDPVTGSANCILVPYWNKQTGKTKFCSQQISKRTGYLQLEMIKDRVIIKGQARTVFEIRTIDL